MNNHQHQHQSTPPQQRHAHVNAVAAAAAGHHSVLHPPFISNSLAIRQEIQRFESVHPSIYAIYDLIDLLPDAQIAQQIRDHVVCIEEPENHGWILNHEGKKALRKVIDTMPCGWPDSGIPPLAPYRREEMLIDVKKSVVETLTKMIRFRVDGLDSMLINKLKISYTFSKKVKFNFTFPQIKISGKYVTNTLLDLLEEYGLHIRYEGNGDFEIILENLNIDGSFKYKMPILFGSIKIYKWNSVVMLGNCVSRINGLLGNGKLNRFINEEIEDTVMWAVNGNQDQISEKIEAFIVPTVNQKMKGHKIWYILGGSNTPECIPPPDPWA